MSANIPFEIQEEIIKYILPVKSLIRFRSVSKHWKSLIESSEFITHHSLNQTHPHHLLVIYNETSEYNYKYVSIVDDDSFPNQKFSPDVSPIVKLVSDASMMDSSQGLVCFYSSTVVGKSVIVVWNPSIRKSVGITSDGFAALGFGVCPKTIEPKIVKITPFCSRTNYEYWKWKAEVLTITSGAWRSIPINILNSYTLAFSFNQVLIDGVIHWHVSEGPENRYILSFDLTGGEFGKINLPENLERKFLSISKVKESLVLLDCHGFEMISDVWKMIKNGDSDFSFEKLYTLSCWADDGRRIYGITGSRKNGQLIREHQCWRIGSKVSTLKAYEPSTGLTSDIEINATCKHPIMMTTYTESLLLLNHSGVMLMMMMALFHHEYAIYESIFIF